MRPAIFMIHGMWAGPWVWDQFVPFFSERGYHCVAPALRYHDVPPGQPPAQLGRVSLLDYAADLQAELDEVAGLPVLMGHSMGGMLAQMLAARRPARALVLLSPMPPQGINVLSRASLRMFRTTLVRWGFWRRPARPAFPDAAAAMLAELPPGDRRAIYDRLVCESGRAACETGFWFADPHRAKYVDTSQITVPVLIVAGGRDLLHPPAMMRQVAERYAPHSTYKEFPGSGHWLTGEPGWPGIAGYVASWLGQLEPAIPHQAGPSKAPVP